MQLDDQRSDQVLAKESLLHTTDINTVQPLGNIARSCNMMRLFPQRL